MKVSWKGRSIVISNTYIPPIRTDALNPETGQPIHGEYRVQTFNAEAIFGKIVESFPECLHIIAGDMNAHHSTWSTAKGNGIGEDIFQFI